MAMTSISDALPLRTHSMPSGQIRKIIRLVKLSEVLALYAGLPWLALFWNSIHPLLHELSARRCPVSTHFLTRWVPRLLGLALVYWAFASAHGGGHRLSLRHPYLGVFHQLIFTCHWISFVYFSRWRYLHPATNPPSPPGLETGIGPQRTLRRSSWN